jgi:hypothetical protein
MLYSFRNWRKSEMACLLEISEWPWTSPGVLLVVATIFGVSLFALTRKEADHAETV